MVFRAVRNRIGNGLHERVFRYLRNAGVTTIARTLLFLRLDAIGDYVLFRNFVTDVRNSSRFVNFRVFLCGNLDWRNMVEGFDSTQFEGCIWVDRRRFEGHMLYRMGILSAVRRLGAEVLVYPTHSREYLLGDFIAACSGAQHKICSSGDMCNMSAAQRELGNRLYDEIIPVPDTGVFEFYRNRVFFEQLLSKPLPDSRLGIPIRREPERHDPFFVLFPGARSPMRRWSEHHFAALANVLIGQYGLKCFLVGSAADSIPCQRIQAKVKSSRIVDLSGQTSLTELCRTISRATILVGNESSGIHIAAAVGTPAVCISNGNHFGRFNPYPYELAPWIVTLYPPAIERDIQEDKMSVVERFQFGSKEDINLVSVERVVDSVNRLLGGATHIAHGI